jgi:hypothetical protein
VKVALVNRLAIALLAFLSPSALFAQGCAMCYQTTAGSGAQVIQALRHGILIMFFPPILIMGAIFYAAYRKRHQFNSTERDAAPASALDPALCDAALNEDVAPDWALADEAELRRLRRNGSQPSAGVNSFPPDFTLSVFAVSLQCFRSARYQRTALGTSRIPPHNRGE